MVIRGILIVFITLLTILLFVILVTSEKFEFSLLYLIALFIALLYILGPGWPSEENKTAWQAESNNVNTEPIVGLKFVSYFLRFFCAVISLNFIYSLFTGSIYINLVGRHSNGPLKQVGFHDSPYVFAVAFIFSGFVFVKSIIWLWPRLKSGLTPPSSGTGESELR